MAAVATFVATAIPAAVALRRRLMARDSVRHAVRVGHGAVIMLGRALGLVVFRTGLGRSRHVRMVVHVVGVAAVRLVTLGLRQVAVILLARGRDVAAVVVLTVGVMLCLARGALGAVLHPGALALETTAAATTTAATAATACSAFTVTLMTALARRTLLHGLLLVHRLFAHGHLGLHGVLDRMLDGSLDRSSLDLRRHLLLGLC